jgi:hypothetical protein
MKNKALTVLNIHTNKYIHTIQSISQHKAFQQHLTITYGSQHHNAWHSSIMQHRQVYGLSNKRQQSVFNAIIIVSQQ